MQEFMSSYNFCRRARLTFLNCSNSVSTGKTVARAGTLGGAGLDLFEQDDEGATDADVGEGELVEVYKGTGSEMRNVETGQQLRC